MTPLQAAVGVVQKGLRPAIPLNCLPQLSHMMTACWDASSMHRWARLSDLARPTAGDGVAGSCGAPWHAPRVVEPVYINRSYFHQADEMVAGSRRQQSTRCSLPAYLSSMQCFCAGCGLLHVVSHAYSSTYSTVTCPSGDDYHAVA